MKHFSEILKNNKIDIKTEYGRLYELFYIVKPSDRDWGISLFNCLEKAFYSFSFRGTCVSLKDFDKTHGFNFERQPKYINTDYLISFCEYSYNLTMHLRFGGHYDLLYSFGNNNYIDFYLQQVNEVIRKLNYRLVQKDTLYEIVPNNAFVEEAVKVYDKSIEERLYEYNHCSYKGDLTKKKEALLAIYDKMAANENELKNINKELFNNLAFAFNNLNLRHNNIDKTSKDFKEPTSKMSKQEIEKWYDDIYQLCVLAILEVGSIKRKKDLNDLKQKY